MCVCVCVCVCVCDSTGFNLPVFNNSLRTSLPIASRHPGQEIRL